MSAQHELLYERALDALRALFGDTSVSPAETRRSLSALEDEIGMMKDQLPEDDGAPDEPGEAL